MACLTLDCCPPEYDTLVAERQRLGMSLFAVTADYGISIKYFIRILKAYKMRRAKRKQKQKKNNSNQEKEKEKEDEEGREKEFNANRTGARTKFVVCKTYGLCNVLIINFPTEAHRK